MKNQGNGGSRHPNQCNRQSRGTATGKDSYRPFSAHLLVNRGQSPGRRAEGLIRHFCLWCDNGKPVPWAGLPPGEWLLLEVTFVKSPKAWGQVLNEHQAPFMACEAPILPEPRASYHQLCGAANNQHHGDAALT